jgi:hypothetical protein
VRLRLQKAWVDGLPIHNVDDPSCPYGLRSAIRTRVLRDARMARPRDHGTVDRTEFYAGQTIELVGYCDAGDDLATEDAIDELSAQFSLMPQGPPPQFKLGAGGAEHVLRFRRLGKLEDELIFFREAAGFEAPAEGWAKLGKWSVTLFGPDPRVYSHIESSGSYDPAVAVGERGVIFPAEVVGGVVFAGTQNGQLLVTNTGTAPTSPLLTVTGPVTNPVIDNDTHNEHIYTTEMQLAAGEQLVVDVAKRTFEVQGQPRLDLVDARLTTWLDLRRGPNYLRLRGTGMVVGQTQLACAWHNARI